MLFPFLNILIVLANFNLLKCLSTLSLWPILMQKKLSLPTFNGGDQLHNSQKQPLSHMDLNLKAQKPLTEEKFPGKISWNSTQLSVTTMIIYFCVTKYHSNKTKQFIIICCGPVGWLGSAGRFSCWVSHEAAFGRQLTYTDLKSSSLGCRSKVDHSHG